jgi:hypothetical protein
VHDPLVCTFYRGYGDLRIDLIPRESARVNRILGIFGTIHRGRSPSFLTFDGADQFLLKRYENRTNCRDNLDVTAHCAQVSTRLMMTSYNAAHPHAQAQRGTVK